MRSKRLAILFSLSLSLSTSVAFAGSVNPGIVDPGAPYAELTGAWWNWAASFPAATSPLLDQTGEFGLLGDQGDIFFLAGNVGGDTSRTVNGVPSGVPIFFPVVNAVFISFPGETLEEARATVNDQINNVSSLFAEIDGMPVIDLRAYRAQSPPGGFVFTNLEGSLFWDPDGFPAGDYPNSAADGYWLLLEPLSPGSHTISFGGVIGDPAEPDFELSVTYAINVVPEPGVAALLGLALFAVGIARTARSAR